MKFATTLLFSLSLVIISCKKKTNGDTNPADTYGEKIVGTWICDSIVEFRPDTNDSLVYYNTDTVPKTYVFTKASGMNMYKWNNIFVEMDEDAGSMYKEGPLGDVGDTWFITYIDSQKCVLKLDYSGGLGSYVTNQYWYYLRR